MSARRASAALLFTVLTAALASSPARFPYAGRPTALVPYRGLQPARQFFLTRPVWRGAGREEPDGPLPATVRIGLIGPLTIAELGTLPAGVQPAVGTDPMLPYGRSLLDGARLAVEEANRAGGYRGRPFELVLRTDRVLWGQTSNELANFRFRDGVWAVLGSINSNHVHVMTRATLKAELPIVNTGTTDPTLTEHAIPWIVRLIPDDRQQAFLLLQYLFAERKFARVAVLRSNERDGRTGVREFTVGAERLGYPVLVEVRYDPGTADYAEALARVEAVQPEAVVLWGNPDDLTRIVQQWHARHFTGQLVGFSRLTLPAFLHDTGDAADGVVAVALLNPEAARPRWQRFAAAFRARFGNDPDFFAAYAYDGMNLIIAAIRRAGLNRTRVRDALFAVQSFDGASGRLEFDTTLNNVAPPWLAAARGGHWMYFRPTEPLRAGGQP